MDCCSILDNSCFTNEQDEKFLVQMKKNKTNLLSKRIGSIRTLVSFETVLCRCGIIISNNPTNRRVVQLIQSTAVINSRPEVALITSTLKEICVNFQLHIFKTTTLKRLKLVFLAEFHTKIWDSKMVYSFSIGFHDLHAFFS